MKKTLTTLAVGALLFAMSACSSTVTLGPKANESSVVGASVGTEGASVTVPLISAEVTTTSETTEKK
tara:strand:- start:1316 stop:1516 length:201 start_codon:yes stop_codon:yes gene_type:complete